MPPRSTVRGCGCTSTKSSHRSSCLGSRQYIFRTFWPFPFIFFPSVDSYCRKNPSYEAKAADAHFIQALKQERHDRGTISCSCAF